MKRVAIMQPYFLPYIGYWQLIHSVDEFVVYDNIEYTKKGWFNRNRILEADHDRLFTIPVKKDSDYLPVNERHLGVDSAKEIEHILRIIETNYRKAPHFSTVFPIITACFRYKGTNLFEYIFHSIKTVCECLEIDTRLVISSHTAADHSLKAEEKVLAICRAEQATTYINASGGVELYDKDHFEADGIMLQFIRSDNVEYQQFGNPFIPSLSIIDVMMFNSTEQITQMLGQYTFL